MADNTFKIYDPDEAERTIIVKHEFDYGFTADFGRRGDSMGISIVILVAVLLFAFLLLNGA